MNSEDRLDNPAPKGSSGNGYHSLEDFEMIASNEAKIAALLPQREFLQRMVTDKNFRFQVLQQPKRDAHVAAMKAKGIWPKDLDDENLRPAEDVE